jgi:hypothetical protein
LREPFVDPATVYQSRSWLDDQALAPAHRGDITSCLLRRAACVDDARFVAHPPDGPAFAPSLVPDAGKGRECGAHRPGLDRLALRTVDPHRRASLPPFAPCYSIDFDLRSLTIAIATACGAVESNEVYPPNDTARSPHACPSADKRYSLGRSCRRRVTGCADDRTDLRQVH